MHTVSSDAVESNGAAAVPEEFVRLEAAVARLLEEGAGLRARAQMAERRAAELERTIRDLSSGGLDPLKLKRGFQELEEENQELRRRMVTARDRIRRLVARFDFLREEL
jgi:predicted RNase H-like nuclease (RuvC/YqgF family)